MLPIPAEAPRAARGEAGARWRGSCHLFLALDVGQEIDLARCARRLAAAPQELKHTRHAPTYFQIEPLPLRLVQRAAPLSIGRFASDAEAELLLYDFGSVSVRLRFELDGTPEEWIDFGAALFDTAAPLEEARRLARELLARISDCVHKAGVDDLLEDYAVFQLPAFREGGGAPEDFVAARAGELARLLRSEREPLSDQEVQDALAQRVAFGRGDLAVVDWNGAILFDDAPEDVRTVLEFANVQLLEMRFLDRQLDRALDRAYATLGGRGWTHLLRPAAFERDLQRVSAMQVDAAILFERVTNALKLYSDQYLARVYRTASQRLRLAEWNSAVLRKLETLEGIYQKTLDRADARRMEFLEWIIIALIVISIALPFLPGYGEHG